MDIKLDNFPEIIKEAAKSTLGVLALMVIILGLLAFYFFKGSDDKVKVGIFVMLFIGVVLFTVSVVNTNNKLSPQHTDAPEKKATTPTNISQKQISAAPPVVKPPVLQTITVKFGPNYENGSLYIDGRLTMPESVGDHQISVSLAKGQHRISVQKGGQQFSRYIVIPSGENEIVTD